ncbi:MAG: helix-turn-helix transcriptional regulator [Deltaproteobacteria bacterium]|jgi:DNA-binding HxlR family transcriptional regulator|nr:helix-turn-helix transcriptional regulator [Deltaproteobacteria bacterium]
MFKKIGYEVSLPKNQSVYEGKCPITETLEIIGGKWKLPILWHLADKKVVRYNELRRSVKGITNMMLTKCLRELEKHGLVRREQYQEIPPRVEYSLTERGGQLLPALKKLYEWGAKQKVNAE